MKISCRKFSTLYKERYNAIISKTNVNEILKYKLGLRSLKTCPKNKILLSNSSKEQAFFILKILIRHLKLGGKIIFIDESTFFTRNTNFKTWRKNCSHIFQDIKETKKLI